MDFGGVINVLSSVEKRYGRSISAIRSQVVSWEEMLRAGEFLLPEEVVVSDGERWPVFVSLPQVKKFQDIFDIGKYLCLFPWMGVEVGLSVSDIDLSKSQWDVWLGILFAMKRTISLSLDIRSSTCLSLMEALLDREGETNLLINLIVGNEFLSALRSGGEVEILDQDILHKKVDVFILTGLINSIKEKGVTIRFVSEDVNRENKLPMFGRQIVFTESGMSLLPGELVPAGWLNLIKFLKREEDFWTLDWEKLEDRIRHAVRLLDDLVDVGVFPRDVFNAFSRTRRLYLGITNWSKLLWYMGIPYASDTAVEFAARLSCFIRDISSDASWQLAKERGVFPLYNSSTLLREGIKRRNVSVWSGVGRYYCKGVSLGGIEPVDSIKESEDGFDWFSECFQRRNLYSEQLLSYVYKNASLSDLEYLPADLRQIFAMRKDIDVSAIQKLQAAFQEFCDGVVDVVLDDWDWEGGLWESFVRGAMAQRLLAKGRDGFQKEQKISNDLSPITKELPKIKEPRPDVLFGSTLQIETACGQLLVTINQDSSGRPRELLLHLPKTGGCVSSFLESLAKMVSLCLENGVPIGEIISALSQINCSSLGWHNGKRVFSCADAVSHVLSERFGKQKVEESAPQIARQVVQ